MLHRPKNPPGVENIFSRWTSRTPRLSCDGGTWSEMPPEKKNLVLVSNGAIFFKWMKCAETMLGINLAIRDHVVAY